MEIGSAAKAVFGLVYEHSVEEAGNPGYFSMKGGTVVMTKEQKFYNALKDVFVGAKVEGESGYINLMRI
ncbi:hypothetical protein M1N68_01880, partial [Peptococcaceae bacterium]|nr:hypothetical protein [Peptococcaceae bacterium]